MRSFVFGLTVRLTRAAARAAAAHTARRRSWLAANLYKGFAFHANKAPPAAADKAS
jgi:hypothetical protein